MKNKITTFVLCMIGFYLLTAFALWKLDASQWPIGARVMYALLAPLASAVITLEPSNTEEK
jgi:hypothetical protein